MVPDTTAAGTVAMVDEASARLLGSAARPIVLMPRTASAHVCEAVAPAIPTSASCCPTHRCTPCCWDCPATSRDRKRS